MGFFSGICSACSSIASGISSAISGVGKALSGFASQAISKVGSFLAGKAAAFVGLVSSLPLGPLGPILGPIIGQMIMKVVAKGIEYLAKKLGIIKEDEKPEKVGYRIEEANEHEEWKKQEEFASFEEYYAYLKKQIPDEQMDLNKLRDNQDRYMVLGTIALTKGIEEQMDIELPEEFLFEIGKSRMEGNEIQAIIEAFKLLGYGSVNAAAYFRGELSREESKRITEALISNMKQYYPDKEEDILYERLGVMRVASRDENELKEIYKDKLEELARTQKMPEI